MSIDVKNILKRAVRPKEWKSLYRENREIVKNSHKVPFMPDRSTKRNIISKSTNRVSTLAPPLSGKQGNRKLRVFRSAYHHSLLRNLLSFPLYLSR